MEASSATLAFMRDGRKTTRHGGKKRGRFRVPVSRAIGRVAGESGADVARHGGDACHKSRNKQQNSLNRGDNNQIEAPQERLKERSRRTSKRDASSPQ